MTRSVVSIHPEGLVSDAARLMLYHKISGLPVVDSAGVLVGIITEGDFLRRGELGIRRTRPRWVEFFTSPGPLAEDYVRAQGRQALRVARRKHPGRQDCRKQRCSRRAGRRSVCERKLSGRTADPAFEE